MKTEYKVIEQDGQKFWEKSDKIAMKISDYGIETVKGSQIAALANIPVGFIVDQSKDYVMLKGFLNNKLIPGTEEGAQDSYGDIPTGKNVYDMGRLINNPVGLCDHDNKSCGIAGNFIFLKETKQGLQFKEILRPLDEIYCDDTKDAVSAWGNGWGKAYSIGGRWLYDWELSDPATNKYILVKAILHEASHVAIGADQWALTMAPVMAMTPGKGETDEIRTLEDEVKSYMETKDEKHLEAIEKLRKEGTENE